MNIVNRVNKAIFFSSAFSFLLGCAASPEEYPNLETYRCEENEGICTGDPASICPAGKEPLTSDDPQYTDCIGHCCITPDVGTACNPAPAQGDTDPVSQIASYNCVPDKDENECPGNWRKVEGGTLCGEGRSCCFWYQ